MGGAMTRNLGIFPVVDSVGPMIEPTGFKVGPTVEPLG